MLERGSKPGWKRVKFGELAENVNDRVDDPRSAGVDRYVGLEHLDADNLKLRRWGAPTDVEATKLRFRIGDIIFGRRRAYQRKLAVADFNGICSAHAMVLRERPGVIVPGFLPFLMQSDVFMRRAVAISVGSLSPTINWTSLREEIFVLPPPSEQQRMCELLNSTSQAADAATDLAVSASLLARSWLKEEFARISHSHPTVVADVVLDRLTVGIVVKPANWYVTPPAGVPALRSLNVLPNRLVLDELVHISDAGHTENRKSELRPGDVAIVRTGRPGDAVVIPDGVGRLNCIDLIIARPSDRLLPSYLSAFLNSSAGRSQFLAGSAGTAQQHFNVSAFRKLRIPLPRLEEQRAVVDTAAGFESAAASAKARAASIRQIHELTLAKFGEM